MYIHIDTSLVNLKPQKIPKDSHNLSHVAQIAVKQKKTKVNRRAETTNL